MCMFKYCGWGIFLIFCHNDGMYCICTSFGSYLMLFMMSHLSQPVFMNSIISQNDITRFHMYIYIYVWYVFVNHNTVQMIIFLPTTFLKRGITLVFPWYLARTIDEENHPWYIYSQGDFFGSLRYNFVMFWSMWHSPMRG